MLFSLEEFEKVHKTTSVDFEIKNFDFILIPTSSLFYYLFIETDFRILKIQ